MICIFCDGVFTATFSSFLRQHNKVDIKIQNRRDKYQTIKPVQYSAVSRNNIRRVLHTCVAFEKRLDEIAKLAAYTDDDPDDDCLMKFQIWKEESLRHDHCEYGA